MSSLQNVVNEFGGSGSVPVNLSSYYKLGAVLNWNGGVAEHSNNSEIPTSGELRLSDFASPADRDFVSDTYTIGIASASFFEPVVGNIGLNAAGVNDDVDNQNAAFGSTAVSPATWGTFGSRKTVGKATYGSSGQTATLTGVWDFAGYLENNFSEGATYIQMIGDQRRSGWGGTGTSGGTSGAAPTSVTISAAGQSPITLNFSSSEVPLGSYDATYNVTTWSWTITVESDLKMLSALYAGQTTFTTRISIF